MNNTLKFCGECEYYGSDPPFFSTSSCHFVKGTEITPIGVEKVYANPKWDNRNNNCIYYEKRKLKGRPFAYKYE